LSGQHGFGRFDSEQFTSAGESAESDFQLVLDARFRELALVVGKECSRLRSGIGNSDQLVGDYTNPVLKPEAVEIVKKHGEISLTGVTYPTPAYPSTHNLGTNRMSEKPKDGVVNKFGQAHDVKNLFISDGSQFTSGAACNPTLTIVSLAIRQADHIAGAMQRKEI